MFTVNKKSLQSMVRPVQIFDTAYQAFLSLNVWNNFRLGQDLSRPAESCQGFEE